MKRFEFTAESGQRFVVELLDHQDLGYFQSKMQEPGSYLYQQPQIQFIPMVRGERNPIGASYYISTFLGVDQFSVGRKHWETGLCLPGGNRAFDLSAADCAKVKDWLDRIGMSEIAPEPRDETSPI